MKFHASILVIGTAAVVLTGCQTPEGRPDYTATGALSGAAIGAGSGALIGGSRNGAAGALIGGAIGLITGGLIGQSLDQQQQERLRAEAPQTYVRVDQGQPLTIADVKALVRAGVGEDVIITQIQNSHTAFHLSANDIIDLHDSGVSDRIIDFMINTGNSVNAVSQQQVVVHQAPPPPPVETVVVAPSPAYVWIDGEWEWSGVTWVWAPGRWILPPRPHAVWVRGYWWHGSGGGWHHHPGHWR